jgi:hypothetical protein
MLLGDEQEAHAWSPTSLTERPVTEAVLGGTEGNCLAIGSFVTRPFRYNSSTRGAPVTCAQPANSVL